MTKKAQRKSSEKVLFVRISNDLHKALEKAAKRRRERPRRSVLVRALLWAALAAEENGG